MPRARAWSRFGDTHVLCTASVDERVPPLLRNTGTGWVTAEYGMLPRSTHTRTDREAARGKQIGPHAGNPAADRPLRCAPSPTSPRMGERQISIDCDVLQADGGTRTAAITGSYVALHLAFQHLVRIGKLAASAARPTASPAISCGMCEGAAVLDLDYAEDSQGAGRRQFRADRQRAASSRSRPPPRRSRSARPQFMELLALAREGHRRIDRAAAALGLCGLG